MTVTPESLIVAGKRRGRPQGAEAHSTVSAYVPARLHDHLVRLAQRREVSVSRIVGDILVQAIFLQNK